MGYNTYLLRRIGQGAFTFFLMFTLSFVLIRLMPGGPLSDLAERVATGELSAGQAEAIREAYNLSDAPIWQQYLQYIEAAMLDLDFGYSRIRNAPVTDVVAKAMPWTIFYSVTLLFIGWFENVALGGLMAFKEGTNVDYGITAFSIGRSGIPGYIWALLFLTTFAYGLGWFPTGGGYNESLQAGLNFAFVASVFYHGALIVGSRFFQSLGGGIGLRANAIKIIEKPYVQVAKLRGLPDSRITLRYVTYNAMLPAYTGFMAGISAIFGGAIIYEQIFRYPGIGRVFLEAINARDYPLMMGSFLITGFMTILGLFIADLTYGLIDPRISMGDDE